jgi:endonuclease/exonuclease/phosphatase (EEP) superfamily protein YafD
LLAVYLFVPLPFVIVAALLLRSRVILIASFLASAVFVWLWGGLFLPQFAPSSNNPGSHSALTVMTYNVLGYHTFTAPVIESIRVENADLVLLQELNPQLAGALQAELADEYPYQILDPVSGVSGMGAISKYPIRRTGESLPLDWVGEPQVLDLELPRDTIRVINFHMVPTTSANAALIDRVNRIRSAQAAALADYARQAGPLIAGGDANATPLSDVHGILSRYLVDAWLEAGFGLGHTFPGSAIRGSSRPYIAGRPVPMWLVRIDYIFHSPHWKTLDARLAKFDGVSDHRGVVAVLALEPGN